MYRDYYLRSVPSLWPQMVHIGVALGVIRVTEQEGQSEQIVSATQGGAWDYIGQIMELTGEVNVVDGIEVPVMVPLTAPSGEVYLHANLRTPINLREAAEALAESNPDLAGAMQNLGLFFLLDEQGNARLPAQPHRVWA